MKTKKKVLIIIVVVLLVGLAIGAKFMLDVQNYQNQIADMEISEIDLSDIPDGTYEGSYDADLIKVKVLVDVENHKITNIDLVEHDNGKGEPAEAVIPKVIESQSVQVDGVSGATNSSKVILKSIELAINSAQN